jgi:UDP-N-acetylmuramoylalanine--D-glutamate ligase
MGGRGGNLELRGRRVVVVGAARTGLSAVKFLNKMGASVILTDNRKKEEIEMTMGSLDRIPVELALGGHRVEAFLKADLIVVSPGVPLTIEPLVAAMNKGIPLMSEIELAFMFIDAPIIAITGTNGKTTTTHLLGRMIERQGKRGFVGGNIGRPLIEAPMEETPAEIVVAEISSFQLEGIISFRPWIGMLLNLNEDHLDRYPTYKHYCDAKKRLFMNQEAVDFSVLNRDDQGVMDIGEASKAYILTFGMEHASNPGAFLHGDTIVYRSPDGEEEHYNIVGTPLKGIHNRQNMMAAVIGARLSGCTKNLVESALHEATGLEHRMEYVAKINQVVYYNDSKATNTGAVIKALSSFAVPVILIAGGKDKGVELHEMRVEIEKRVKALILLGEARERMTRELAGSAPIFQVESIKEAVQTASTLAEAGDVVLLSPACSSFDHYRDYEERGEDFKARVYALQ